jgi:exopolysaccharide production protein ExoZ
MHTKDAIPRLGSVQMLRGVAALLVVLLHALDAAERVNGTIRVPLLGPFDNMGASGVDLFFVISGFVMALGLDGRNRSPVHFLKDRAIRILPLLWILSCAFLAIFPPAPGQFVTQAVVNTLTILPLTDGAYYDAPILFVGWTLAFEFAFYLLVALVLSVSRDAGQRVQLLTMAVLGAAMLGVGFRPEWAALRILINPIMFEFSFGVIAYWIWRSGGFAAHAKSSIYVGLGLLVLTAETGASTSLSIDYQATTDHGGGLIRSAMFGVPWALIFAGVISLPTPEGRGARWLHALGDASYSIYLVHVFVMRAAISLIEAGLVGNIYLVLAVTFMSSLGLGIIVNRVIEKPVIAFLKRRSGVAASVALTTG